MKGLVNGVVNAFIAEAISVLLDSHRGGRLPSLQRVLSTLLIAFVCLGALFLISPSGAGKNSAIWRRT